MPCGDVSQAKGSKDLVDDNLATTPRATTYGLPSDREQYANVLTPESREKTKKLDEGALPSGIFNAGRLAALRTELPMRGICLS